jgi:phosphate transport system protein
MGYNNIKEWTCVTSRKQFDQELASLKLNLVQMGDLVIRHINEGLDSFVRLDVELANQVIISDKAVNEYEHSIEKNCLGIILREQPVASDLRLITAVLKMITDLERIGDHAADISKMALFMEKTQTYYRVDDIFGMMNVCQEMIRHALESFVASDLVLAQSVISADDTVDHLFEKTKKHVANALRNAAVDADYAIYLMMVAKYLERIGDHAVNIAEWVIFSMTGEHV